MPEQKPKSEHMFLKLSALAFATWGLPVILFGLYDPIKCNTVSYTQESEPVKKQPSKVERILKQYDLDGDTTNLNKQELSNLIKDYTSKY